MNPTDDACRARARGRLAGERGETPFDLEAAGSCLHLRHAICWRLRSPEETVANPFLAKVFFFKLCMQWMEINYIEMFPEFGINEYSKYS